MPTLMLRRLAATMTRCINAIVYRIDGQISLEAGRVLQKVPWIYVLCWVKTLAYAY
jgi:hypothetical protein